MKVAVVVFSLFVLSLEMSFALGRKPKYDGEVCRLGGAICNDGTEFLENRLGAGDCLGVEFKCNQLCHEHAGVFECKVIKAGEGKRELDESVR